MFFGNFYLPTCQFGTQLRYRFDDTLNSFRRVAHCDGFIYDVDEEDTKAPKLEQKFVIFFFSVWELPEVMMEDRGGQATILCD